MEKEFTDWFKANENRFSHSQFDEKQIAYSAWLEGKNEVLRKHAVSSSVCHCSELPNGEIAISSKALQKPYGDLGQTDC